MSVYSFNSRAMADSDFMKAVHRIVIMKIGNGHRDDKKRCPIVMPGENVHPWL